MAGRKRSRVEAADLYPGDAAILVLHVTVLRRQDTAHGPRFKVEMPEWIGGDDLAPVEPALARLAAAREKAEANG